MLSQTDVQEAFGHREQMALSDLKEELIEKDESVKPEEAKQIILKSTQNVGFEDGQMIVELLDESIKPEEAAADPDENIVQSDLEGWQTDATARTVEVGEIDQESGAPTNEKFHHVPVREDVGHPLVPNVPNYVPQEYDDGVTDVEAATFYASDPDMSLQLIGEPGTGKGHMVKWICQNANIPLVRVNMGMSITRSKLIGRFVPRNGDNGLEEQLERAKDLAEGEDVSVEKALEIMNVREKFEWRDGLLTAAVKHGFWFLADEINAADSELLLPLNGLLED